MKKRNLYANRGKLRNNTRRRLLLKRVHQKVLLRRQQFLQSEMFDDMAEAC